MTAHCLDESFGSLPGRGLNRESPFFSRRSTPATMAR